MAVLDLKKHSFFIASLVNLIPLYLKFAMENVWHNWQNCQACWRKNKLVEAECKLNVKSVLTWHEYRLEYKTGVQDSENVQKCAKLIRLQ